MRKLSGISLGFLVVLVFILASYLQIQAADASTVQCLPAESAALLSFKAGIKEDPAGLLANWLPHTDCCNWDYVGCNSKGHVISVNLNPNPPVNTGVFLTGPLGSWFCDLPQLQVLDLSQMQNLTGTIPSAIGNLIDLVHLFLSTNKLKGTIPSTIGNLKKLQTLSLGENRITGSIPSSLGDIGPSLTYIDFGSASLSGSIPDSLYQLTNLNALFLIHNHMSGPLSPLIGNLAQLEDLEISTNEFSGPLPSTLGKLSKLSVLDLSNNKFSGSMPASIGDIVNLGDLNLANNRLTGIIPPMWNTQLANLDGISLNRNFLSGPIPYGGPFLYNGVDTFRPGNPGLCDDPLPPCKTKHKL
ncbi:unnamed protein product [Sphagnum compactum]